MGWTLTSWRRYQKGLTLSQVCLIAGLSIAVNMLGIHGSEINVDESPAISRWGDPSFYLMGLLSCCLVAFGLLNHRRLTLRFMDSATPTERQLIHWASVKPRVFSAAAAFVGFVAVFALLEETPWFWLALFCALVIICVFLITRALRVRRDSFEALLEDDRPASGLDLPTFTDTPKMGS